MSTPASRPLLVRVPTSVGACDAHIVAIGHLIYKCGGIDSRTIEKFEKVNGIAFLFSVKVTG
jgi:hypothetical protein